MSNLRHLGKQLYYYPKPTKFSEGLGAELPEEYKKFWREWKEKEPKPVHYIPKEGKYERHRNGDILPVENRALPLSIPKDLHEGIWGGEAIVEGFRKKKRATNRVPTFWVPNLLKNVLYSEVLDEYFHCTVTQRTMFLIHENYGFDHYILKTEACDLMSELALKFKRKILLALADKTLYPDDSEKREEVYEKYKDYLKTYTREEIEWYGLNFNEAIKKLEKIKYSAVEANIKPLKIQFREELLKQLREENNMSKDEGGSASTSSSTWLSKINVFKNKET